MNISEKLHRFIDGFIPDSSIDLDKNVDINKSVTTRYSTLVYYTIKDNNILTLGDTLPADAMDEAQSTSGKYLLLVGRGEYSYNLKFNVETLPENSTQSDAQSRAIDLVEENKNSVKFVMVCVGVNKTFAGRPVYQGFVQYQHVAKSTLPNDNDIIDIYKIYSSVDEVPDSVPANKKKQFLEVWNATYAKHKNEKTAFKYAWGVINKSEPDPSDLHVDKLENGICPECGKSPCECDEIEKQMVVIEKLTPDASHYADPGYQKDGKKRYPLDTPTHVRAAASYFGMPKNRSKYSSEHQKAISAKIATAKKKFGIGEDNVEKSDESIDCFIPITKSSLVDGLVYGIVYEPLKKDTHGDWTTAEEIRKWAHNFLPSALANGTWTNKNHKDELTKHDVEIVESYIAPCDFDFPNNQHVIKGSWVVVSRVNSPELRKSIEADEISGYSLEGIGRRIDKELNLNENVA